MQRASNLADSPARFYVAATNPATRFRYTKNMQPQDPPPPARRSFLAVLAAGALGLPFLAPILASLRTLKPSKDAAVKPRPAVPLARIPKDKPLAYRVSYVEIQGPYRQTIERLVFLRRTDDGVLALGGECTHAGCNVDWDEERQVFACPCHDGAFTADGEPSAGPPKEPLARYKTHIGAENEAITIEV